jgi:phosphatidylcholine synthase
MVDNVIDFFTYIWIPVFIMERAGILPHPAWIVVPILAGLYAYGQENMKTPDGFFLGFPSHWNVIALYLYWLRPEPLWAVLALVIPGVLTFVPTRYLYPSKSRILRAPTFFFGALWTVLVLVLLAQPAPDMRLVWLSALYPAYYLGASFYVDWRMRRVSAQP